MNSQINPNTNAMYKCSLVINSKCKPSKTKYTPINTKKVSAIILTPGYFSIKSLKYLAANTIKIIAATTAAIIISTCSTNPTALKILSKEKIISMNTIWIIMEITETVFLIISPVGPTSGAGISC